jgi:hypothetical protein
MLSILILAYQGRSVQDLPAAVPLSPAQFEKAVADLHTAYGRLLDAQSGTPEAQQALIAVQTASEQVLLVGRFAARRRHLFATYTERVLHRRSSGTYTSQQTIQWLSWLAKTMLMNDQMVFSVERPLKKLPNPPSRRYLLVSELIVWLVGGLLIGLVLCLLFGLAVELIFRPLGLVTSQLSMQVGLVFVLSIGLVSMLIKLVIQLVEGPFRRLLAGEQKGYNIESLALQWYLYRTGALPWDGIWDYRHFLDFAAERILLRKVGRDYIFVHRLLLDYLALLEMPSSQKRSRH